MPVQNSVAQRVSVGCRLLDFSGLEGMGIAAYLVQLAP